MRRHLLGVLMALTVGGLGLAATASTASALTRPTNTTINMTVGHSTNVKVGQGKVYLIKSCTSGAPSTVACQLNGPITKVELWCLAPTNGAVSVVVAYIPDGSSNPIASTTLDVNCKPAPIETIQVEAIKTVTPLQAVSILAPNSCSTNVLGAQCTTEGTTVVEACLLQVTANALPARVTATVTVEGLPAINGKQIQVYFTCVA